MCINEKQYPLDGTGEITATRRASVSPDEVTGVCVLIVTEDVLVRRDRIPFLISPLDRTVICKDRAEADSLKIGFLNFDTETTAAILRRRDISKGWSSTKTNVQ